MEQKKYTLLPKQTVDTWVEAIGVNKIPDEVSEILSEDITYHIRELVHVSMIDKVKSFYNSFLNFLKSIPFKFGSSFCYHLETMSA